MNLKAGLSFRHLEQNRNIFQINIQKLESIRKKKIRLSKKLALLMMVPLCYREFCISWTKQFHGGSVFMEFKIIKVQ